MNLRLRGLYGIQDVAILIQDWAREIPAKFAEKMSALQQKQSGSPLQAFAGQAVLLDTSSGTTVIVLEAPGPANVGKQFLARVASGSNGFLVTLGSGASAIDGSTSVAFGTSEPARLVSHGNGGWWSY